MGNDAFYFPTWSDEGGQDDIEWWYLGGGSWSRMGLSFDHATGAVPSGYGSLYKPWTTHVYYEDTDRGSPFQMNWFPIITVKYNANGRK